MRALDLQRERNANGKRAHKPPSRMKTAVANQKFFKNENGRREAKIRAQNPKKGLQKYKKSSTTENCHRKRKPALED